MMPPDEVDNPERSLSLENREVKAARPRRLAPISTPAGQPSAQEMLAALRQRIAKAHKVEPEVLHCRDCFGRGRDAALRVIEGE